MRGETSEQAAAMDLLREGQQLVKDQATVIEQLTAALTAIHETAATGSPDAVLLSIESIARHALREAANA